MKLALGTAQFGLDYGVTNSRGKILETEAKAILANAQSRGIDLLDTAALYGESEMVLGKILPANHKFKIVTKTGGDLRYSFLTSLERLKQKKLYGLLFHRPQDLLSGSGPKLYADASLLKKEGFVKKIGVSVYDPEETRKILNKYDLDIIQLPINVFDQRFIQDGTLKELLSRKIEIHMRSIFLQGLLLQDSLPDYFEPLRPTAARYHKTLKAKGLTPLQGALSFASGLGVDYGIVGVSSLPEWEEINRAFSLIARPMEVIGFRDFACQDEKMVNPTFWPALKVAGGRK